MNWRHFPMMTAICWFSNILQRLTVSQIINQFGSFLLSDCRSARAGCTQSFLLNCSCQVDLKHILCALDFSCQEVVKASTLTQKDHNPGLGLVLPTLISVKIHLQIIQDQGLISCKKLIETIFNGLKKRFSHLFKKEFYIISAISTPYLKNNWIFDNKDRQKATELLKKEVKKVQKLQS